MLSVVAFGDSGLVKDFIFINLISSSGDNWQLSSAPISQSAAVRHLSNLICEVEVYCGAFQLIF